MIDSDPEGAILFVHWYNNKIHIEIQTLYLKLDILSHFKF